MITHDERVNIVLYYSYVTNVPVYNNSRDFPLLLEEMRISVTYAWNRAGAEQILLDAANARTKDVSALGIVALPSMMRRFAMEEADTKPHVFHRITDNWLELGLRFLAPFDAEGIGIASATCDRVGFPASRYAADSKTNASPTPPTGSAPRRASE